MPDLHAVMIFDIAPEVAETFRADPKVASLSDPAVLLEVQGAGCVASVLEESELIEILSAATLEEGIFFQDVPRGDGLISFLVVDEESASHYRVPDPRFTPKEWPWMGDPEY